MKGLFSVGQFLVIFLTFAGGPFAVSMFAQNTYVAPASPIEILKVDPHSHTKCSLVAALSNSDPDPWYTCLLISYKNVSSQRIAGVRFNVNFISAMKEVDADTVSVESIQSLKPGKSFTTFWHDGIYWQRYGDQMGANVVVARVMFADGSFWTSPAEKSESSPASPEFARTILLKTINHTFTRDSAVGYAEIAGDNLVVHSERASAMRFHMILASQEVLSLMERAEIALFIYSNDGPQKFVYDVKAAKVLDASASASSSAPH